MASNPPAPLAQATAADDGPQATSAAASPTAASPTAWSGSFFDVQACPPGRYGCVLSRTVTDDIVRTQLSCPAGLSSYSTSHVLHRLVMSPVETTAGPGIARAEILDEQYVRQPIVRVLDRLEACFRSTRGTQLVDIAIVIRPTGSVLSTRSTADDPHCIDDVVSNIGFPSATAPTYATWQLDYYVEDPTDYVKPLDCSFVASP